MMNIEYNINGSSYVSDFDDADEFTAYNNGDGTFMVELQAWGIDRDGNKKRMLINFPHIRFSNMEVLMGLGDPAYTTLIKE